MTNRTLKTYSCKPKQKEGEREREGMRKERRNVEDPPKSMFTTLYIHKEKQCYDREVSC